MSDDDQQVVTEAIWRPGLPPPIEALKEQFPPEDGYSVEYGTRQRNEREPGGWRGTPVAIVTARDGREWTFFPRLPGNFGGSARGRSDLRARERQ